jgi:hypothetical protein
MYLSEPRICTGRIYNMQKYSESFQNSSGRGLGMAAIETSSHQDRLNLLRREPYPTFFFYNRNKTQTPGIIQLLFRPTKLNSASDKHQAPSMPPQFREHRAV